MKKEEDDKKPKDKSPIPFRKKEQSIPPALILDVDKGIDFTFKGMGLKGNRIKKDK